MSAYENINDTSGFNQPDTKTAENLSKDAKKSENTSSEQPSQSNMPAANLASDLETKMPAASDVTPRSTSDFIVRPPIYVKGVPVADNIKNRLLIREIDREAQLQEKIAKTHILDKFYPYQPPVLGHSHGQKKPPYSQDKSAHKKQHQHELHEWHKVQKKMQRRMNEENKQRNGIHEGRRVEKRVQRVAPSQEVTRFKEKTHTRRWVSKRRHARDAKERSY